ncbi:unnamed protein product, partial [Pylaiella littoralis]
LALPGARLPPELLPPPEPALLEGGTAAEVAVAAGGGGMSREPSVDWGQHIRLTGTVRVEVALEDRAGDPDLMGLATAGGGAAPGGQDEGVLVESVALVGSLVPGPTFGLSCSSVTVVLRPPESGGGGGGGHGDETHPYDPEGPASFFVESFSQSLGPVRLKLAGGGRLFLDRGVRVPAADDEGGGRRQPARVARLVTAIAEPSRGIVSANRRREVAVRLIAAEQGEGCAGAAGYDDEEDGLSDGIREDQCDLFVSIMDADHPGYPPQVVSVLVDVPAAAMVVPDPEDGEVGRVSPGEDGSVDVLTGGAGRWSSNGNATDASARTEAEEARGSARSRSEMAQVGDTAATAKSSTVEGGGGGGGGAAGGGASRTDKFLSKKSSGFFPPLSGAAAAAAEPTGASSSSSSSAIAAATAAAIAAGPLKLGASASDFEGSGTGAALPLLEMRGCTPIGNKSSRFEINLGQQLAHLSSLEWQVSLMWPAARRVRRASHSPSLLGAAGDGAGVGGISSGSSSGGGGGGGGGSSSNS